MKLAMDIVSYIFDMAMLYIFNSAYFRRVKFGLPSSVLIGIYAAVECSSAFINHSREDIWVNMAVSLVGLSVVALCYEGRFWNYVTGVALFQLLAIMAEMLSAEILHIMPKTNTVQADGLLLSKLILFIFIILVQFFHTDRSNIPSKYLLYFTFIPVLSIFILYGVTDNAGSGKMTMYLLVICILLINLISYYLLNLLADYIIRENETLQMQNQIKIQKEKYAQLTAAFSKGNRMLHDVNKHLRFIHQTLETGDVENAMSYIEKIDETLKENYNKVQTGNIVLDSILNNLHTSLAETGCGCEIIINMDAHKIRMEDYDLVIVLGNITDNQIEAVTQVTQEERKKVHLELTMNMGSFLIYAKNGVSDKGKKYLGINRWFHGFGMQNIEEVVNRYGGTLSFEKKNGWFEMMIQIPMEDCDEC